MGQDFTHLPGRSGSAMSAPVRFLAVAVFGWITVRAAAQALMVEPLPPLPSVTSETPVADGALSDQGREAVAALPPGYADPYGAPYPAEQTAAAIPSGYYPASSLYPTYAAAPYPAPRSAGPAIAYYYPYPVAPAVAPRSRRPSPEWLAPARGGLDFSDMPDAGDAPMSRAAAFPDPSPPGTTTPSFLGTAPSRDPRRLDRLSLSNWALLRQQKTIIDLTRSGRDVIAPAPPALATGGVLGGSQAGMRLTYRFNRAFSANLRVSAPISQASRTKMSGEAALGVAWQPLPQVPIRVMAERRKAFGGPGGGRDAFAVLAEGGVYDTPLPFQFRLDGYGQAGVVGARSRDWFVDGGLTASRPLFGRFGAGFGIWGGAQPGLARLDLGPRLSMRLLPTVRAHLDYRYRLLGKAEPASGFAVTVAADF